MHRLDDPPCSPPLLSPPAQEVLPSSQLMLLRNENSAPFPFPCPPPSLPPPPLAPHRIRLHHARLLTAPECNHTLTSRLSSCSPAGDTRLLHTDGLCVMLPSSIFNVFPWAGRTGAMRLHSASAVASMDITHRSTRGVLKHGLLCCPPYFNTQSTEHLLHTCRRTHTEAHLHGSWFPSYRRRGGGGVSPSFHFGPVRISARGRIKKGGLPSYLPTVWLASCRIRLNCFFILYFCLR